MHTQTSLRKSRLNLGLKLKNKYVHIRAYKPKYMHLLIGRYVEPNLLRF